MNIVKMYTRICHIAQELSRDGCYRRGRRTGDAAHDNYLWQVRLHKAALKKLSQAEQKEWMNHVAEVNEDLIGHWRHQANSQRVHSRKRSVGLDLPRSLKRRHVEQGHTRFLRIQAINEVFTRLYKEGKKPTTKRVAGAMAEYFPDIPIVQLDTLRKDIKRLKVARQSH